MAAAPQDAHMAAGSGEPLVELRGMAPRRLVSILEAISSCRRQARNDLVVEILSEWAAAREHEAMLLQRVLRGNPPSTELERNPAP